MREVDVDDRLVKLAHGPGQHRTVTAHWIFTQIYMLVHRLENGDRLSPFERSVAEAMIWWLHPLPEPGEWHAPRVPPAPRPKPLPV